jgi:ThiF family
MQVLNPIDCASFYAERDHRTNLALQQPPFPVPLAVSISPEWAATPNGQLALYWLSSLISRMGQRYNQLMVFLPKEIAGLRCLIAGFPSTLADAILNHLQASDPCGGYQLVTELSDDIPLISVGKLQRRHQHIVIEPHGWSAMITTSDTSTASSDPHEWLNPIGAALAASLGATEVYFQFNHQNLVGRQSQVPLWISARHCAVTTSEDEATNWDDDIPFPDEIDIGRWLVVGAGALGGNALAIIGMARESLKGSIDIVDPDAVELSNLNRLVESLAAHVQVLKKVNLATLGFRDSKVEIRPHDVSYEFLRKSNKLIVEDFDLVMTGVDQMATRAFVQSDWPRFVVDGGTRGYTWRVSTIGNDESTACLGCLAGKSQRHFSDLASPLACAIGLADQLAIPTPMDSYGFVSFVASAFMVARAIEKCLANSPAGNIGFTTGAVALNLRNLQHKREEPSQSCLCMCLDPVVRQYREEKFSEHTS